MNYVITLLFSGYNLGGLGWASYPQSERNIFELDGTGEAFSATGVFCASSCFAVCFAALKHFISSSTCIVSDSTRSNFSLTVFSSS